MFEILVSIICKCVSLRKYYYLLLSRLNSVLPLSTLDL